MAYPQPGPFPAYPQYPGQAGAPAKPPIPQTVQSAFYLMLAGAVLSLVAIAVTAAEYSKIRDLLHTQNLALTDDQVHTRATALIVGAVVGGLLRAGLWIWMAFANRDGKGWARITGTVFFGINTLGVIIGLIVTGVSATNTAKVSAIDTTISVLTWLVGLAALILLWHKESNPYFDRRQFGGPGGPYAPYPYPYPYGAPGQQQPPYDQPPQQPPSDPWGNPPQQ